MAGGEASGQRRRAQRVRPEPRPIQVTYTGHMDRWSSRNLWIAARFRADPVTCSATCVLLRRSWQKWVTPDGNYKAKSQHSLTGKVCRYCLLAAHGWILIDQKTRDDITSKTKHLYSICTMLAQHLRRWTNTVQLLYKCFVFTGICRLSRDWRRFDFWGDVTDDVPALNQHYLVVY